MKNPRHNQKIETLLKIITTPRQKHMKKVHGKCIEITGNHWKVLQKHGKKTIKIIQRKKNLENLKKSSNSTSGKQKDQDFSQNHLRYQVKTYKNLENQ